MPSNVMKAITPVIALVMLMLITVGLVGTAAVWFSGILNSSTEKSISVPMGGAYCVGPFLTVMILNNGASSSISNADIKTLRIDGIVVAPAIPSAIKPGEANSVTPVGYICGGSCAGASHDIVIGTSANVVQTRAVCK